MSDRTLQQSVVPNLEQHDHQAHAFDIKPGVVRLLPKYSGKPQEDPIQHLDDLVEVCDLIKPADVPMERMLLEVFHLSLTDRAAEWHKTLPPESVTTWVALRRCFLADFLQKPTPTPDDQTMTMFQTVLESIGQLGAIVQEEREIAKARSNLIHDKMAEDQEVSKANWNSITTNMNQLAEVVNMLQMEHKQLKDEVHACRGQENLREGDFYEHEGDGRSRKRPGT